jgi:hypothetical protein
MSSRCPSSIPLVPILLAWSLTAGAQAAVPNPPPSVCVNGNCVSAPAPSTSTATGVKWHPGHYALSNQIVSASNPNWTNVKAEIDQTLTQANISGYMAIYLWNSIEPATAGSYVWTNIDQARSYIATNYPGKRFAVQIWTENFFGADPTAVLPNNGGISAAWWRPAVRGRIQALFLALATHPSPYLTGYTYDTDPYFEVVSWQESSLNLISTPPDYSISAAQNQWEAIISGMVVSFPHTNVADLNNFLGYTGDSAVITGNVEVADASARAAISSPDIFYGVSNYTWGQLAYIGSANGGTSGFTSQAGAAPYIAFVEDGDWPVNGGPSGNTMGNMMATALNAVTNNGLQAAEAFWSIEPLGSGVAGDWTSTTLPAINANPIPTLNQRCPTLYRSCNTQ